MEEATERLLHHGMESLELFPVVYISRGPQVSFITTVEFSVREAKITSRIGFS